MENKKKPLIITLICIAVLAAAAAGVWFLWLKDYLIAVNSAPVYVNPISSIVGLDTGSNPRYSGIVEPQETFKIQKDESKTVSEVLIKEGDEVHVGDVLFRYDTNSLQLELQQAQIDQEGISQQISELKSQLTSLEAEKKKASQDEQLGYTVQIQRVTLQIKQQENESSKKATEIEKLQQSLNSTDVLSEVEGVVKEINSTGQTDPYTGQAKPFITILAAGDYRVKGTVSELNVRELSVGQMVTVHSRLDSQQSWKGTVESIDQEAASDQSSMNYYYPGMDSGEKSSQYNFYVLLENPEGLILGQHVYIEPDLGEAAKKEGLWLPAMYVAHDESGSFVWAKDDRDKLEKRLVILGAYDNENDMYEIKSGITRVDSIAYPSEGLIPGMPITMDASLQGNYPMTGADGADGSMTGVPDGAANGDIGGMDGAVDGSVDNTAGGTVDGGILYGSNDVTAIPESGYDEGSYDDFQEDGDSYDDPSPEESGYDSSGEGYVQ